MTTNMKTRIFLAPLIIVAAFFTSSAPPLLFADEVSALRAEVDELRRAVNELQGNSKNASSTPSDQSSSGSGNGGQYMRANEDDMYTELKTEIEELKMITSVLEEEKNDIYDRIRKAMSISGYADTEYTLTSKKNDESGFRVHHLSLFYTQDLTDRFSLFSELEFEDAPKQEGARNDGKIFVEVMTLNYSLNKYLNFRLGRYLTPAGIWNVEHYPPFVPTQTRPLHIRKIFPQINDGLQLFGNTQLSTDVTADYTIYAGNGTGDNTGHGDNNENKAVGARVKFNLPFFTSTELGFSGYKEREQDHTDRMAFGTDIRVRWRDITFQGEYARGRFDPAGSGRDSYRTGYYGQLEYDLSDKWSFMYRHDLYEPSSVVDKDATTTNTLAVNYHFTPSIVGKVEHHFVGQQGTRSRNGAGFDNEDFNRTTFSMVYYLSK